MNKQMLSEMRWKRVRLSPIARRIDDRMGVELEQIDDAWMIEDASRERLVLANPRSNQRIVLGTDHIREYMTDFGRSDGVLVLKSQVFLFAGQMPRIEPLHPLI